MKKPIRVMTVIDTVEGERLVNALSLAETPELMRLFLLDLLTTKEIENISRRLQLVEMIYLGMPYESAESTLRFSSKTIARISKLTTNKHGGFLKIMKRLYPRKFGYLEN